MTPRHAAYGLCALLAALALLWGLGAWQQHRGAQGDHQAAIHTGEANAHASQAQAVPDHSEALAAEKANADRAWSEVRRLRALVAAQTPGVPGPAEGPGPAVGQPPADHRDELLAADRVLIEAQAGQIAALVLALKDEQRRSSEWKAAFEAERKATAAQQAATEAWRGAVTASRWRGRIEGFAAGVALGYVARGQR